MNNKGAATVALARVPLLTFTVVQDGTHKQRLLARTRQLRPMLQDKLEEKRRGVLQNRLATKLGILFPGG